ncbi:16S rRNA (uracil(1498)-N(3))-methyltransferase [Reichenbachiella agarivorans]|uniref:Ribosomal RNA small subunit methyltransferase E n=1 Tax=Reichenbachiella agarivorans TaxID=2979464 RepID=A0ABY6CND3_9BACT|nr:RsmE family RNA methyltransferase [Reichenbachiella agarivorans]UXP32028.1 16S rRNA (uracil(1498)-N(3))-methyltransferase [Reichenbachiella agarivorans]
MNYYYHPDPESKPVLNGEESMHAVKVLRKKEGDEILIMDGKGGKYKAEITDANFRKCSFKITQKKLIDKRPHTIHLAIAPTKNIDRLEWFVEKACELGVDQITILLTKRTERKKINLERIEKKAISAMKQSKNFWKCQINDLIAFDQFVSSPATNTQQSYIAYAETGHESSLHQLLQPNKETLIMIGPEGDFTSEEVQLAVKHGSVAVNLGASILRTETAGVIAVHTFNLVNGF